VWIEFSSPTATGMDTAEYEELRELAQEGLELLSDASAERKAVLLEMSAFAEFLVERLPVLEQEWNARREALVAEGRLPAVSRDSRGDRG
jgi:hypothetical protein